MELISHKSIDEVLQVGGGWWVTMQYKFNSTVGLKDALGKVYFIDMRNKKPVERDWKYVYYGSEERTRDVCIKMSLAKSETESFCEEYKKENYTYEGWLDYNSRDIPEGEILLGLMVYNLPNDYVDGIWEIGDLKVDRHASWNATLETNLIGWWTLNQTSGTTAINSHNSSLNGVASNERIFTGTNDKKLGENAGNFTQGDDKVNLTFTSHPTNSFTYAAWININSFGISGTQWIRGIFGVPAGNDGYITMKVGQGNQESNKQKLNVGFYNTASAYTELTGTTLLNLTTWYYVATTYNGSVLKLYINGVEEATSTPGTTPKPGQTVFLGIDSNVRFWDGLIDEAAVWSRSLTPDEISLLYSGGNGCTYKTCVGDAVPSVTLNSPVDAFKTNNSEIIFNVTVTDDFRVENVTLYINGAVNETNTSNVNGTYLFTKTLNDGNYNWSILAYDNNTQSTQSATRTFTIDTTPPVIIITYPNETITFHKLNTNLTLNWTFVETNPDTCRFNWNGVYTTINCTANTTSFNITDGTVKTLTIYANDTAGNLVSNTSTWNYRLFLNSETYTASVTEGVSTTISANLLTNGSAITTAILNHGGTEYVGSINDHGSNNYTITKTIIAPTVTTNTNYSFFWNITQGLMSYSLTNNTQLITDFSFDNCSTNSITLYNFTLVDEKTQTNINATGNDTLGKVSITLNSITGSELGTFSSSYSQINPFRVCVNSTLSSGETFLIDAIIEYSSTVHETEFYHIQNQTLTNATLYQNITLYDLLTNESQVFKLIVKDSSFLPLTDAIVEVHRKYIDEGIYKIVEIPKTDGNGETTAHLVVNDVIYKFVIKKYGETISTFENVIAVCQTPLVTPCTINFNAVTTSEITVPDYEVLDDFNFTLEYNESSRIVRSLFVIPSGLTSTVKLEVIKEDALGTAVCDHTLISSSGTLTCTVPNSFGNSTVFAKLYKDGDLQAQGNIKLDKDILGVKGVMIAVLSVFILMTLIGAGLSDNPVYTILFLMLGVILLFSLNIVASEGFIGAGATILWLIVAIILVIIKGARRN